MSALFPAPPSHFVGRDETIARFKSRLEHFRLFIYEGIAGVGKTALLLRLAKETKAVGAVGALYIPAYPGERWASILARVEARVSGTGTGTRTTLDRQGDPYTRLTEVLEANKLVLLLDNLENLPRSDMTTMVRVFKHREGRYRVVAAIRGDPELSNVDRVALHHERLGALTPDEVQALAKAYRVDAAAQDLLRADAARGGCAAHPLTLRHLIRCAAHGRLPTDEFLRRQSARSVTAFKALLADTRGLMDDGARQILGGLSRIGAPLTKAVAAKALGGAVDQLLQAGFVDEIEGDLYVHELVAQAFASDGAFDPAASKALAGALRARAAAASEPVALMRASELLARSGLTEDAVDMLADGWRVIRDHGFLETYLKTLASIPSNDKIAGRLKLLAARARMRQGAVSSALRAELEELATDHDAWTKSRALGALAYLRSQAGEHAGVVAAFDELQALAPGADIILQSGCFAAEALVRLDRPAEAEKLAKQLLTRLKTNKRPELEGELRRLLGRVYGQAGKLALAVAEARKAAQAFESSGDLYHAAMTYGSIGDLLRETGEFEGAREAFREFLELANRWGDRDLVHIAELSDAWVSLDVGDLPHAAKTLAQVASDLSAAPSRRLKRYLEAARGLLEAGRGHHEAAADQLAEVIPSWEAAGQQAVADVLRAQQVRSLIASGDLARAEAIAVDSLAKLDPETAAPRVAIFLRESALINLRRGDPDKAMDELARARQLFGKGGNRREEALTLHRIAHAALDEGDLVRAKKSADEAWKLAKQIKHARAAALAQEVRGRIALQEGDADKAVQLGKEALQSLRKLGDELGALHVSEWLLRAELVSGDVASVLRSGPKVAQNAQRLEIREVRVRAIVLTGVAMLRRGRVQLAARCFRDLPDKGFSAWTRALTWRFGEALASVRGEKREQQQRATRRVEAFRSMPEPRRSMMMGSLQQLDLPPRERSKVRTPEGETLLGTEQLGLLDPADYLLMVDAGARRIYDKGKPVELSSPAAAALLARLSVSAPDPVPHATCFRLLFGTTPPDAKPDKQVRARIKEISDELKPYKSVTVTAAANGVKLSLPKRYALVLPTWMLGPKLGEPQRRIVKLLRRFANVALPLIQSECELTRSAARREIGALVDAGLVESVRSGRGQAYRLA